jgi:hypothetical protein
LDASEGREGVTENINIVVIDVWYGLLDGFKYSQSFCGIYWEAGDLDIFAANIAVFPLHRIVKDGIPAVFKMLLMELKRKTPMDRRIPELWIGSKFLGM